MLALATIILLNFAQPGVDTLPPTVAVTAQGCGTRMILAEEKRNTPDPPNSLPGQDDQLDRGIASISFLSDPIAVNLRIVLITDTQFPQTPSYKTFVARVELIDPTMTGSGVVVVRDFAGNAETRLINIAATRPALSSQQIQTGIVYVGASSTQTLTITNTTGAPMTLSNIRLQTGTRFTITQGAVPPSVVLQPNATHNVVVSYTPTLDSESGDADALNVTSDCAELSVPVGGTGGVARILTEDWNAGPRQTNDRICKTGGITVTNNGNVELVLTSAVSTSAEFVYTPAPFPISIAAGASSMIGDVCYEALTLGNASGFILVTSNANVGDTVAVLTAEAVTTGVEDDVISIEERTTSSTPCYMYDLRGILYAHLEGGLRTLQPDKAPIGMYLIVYPDAPRRVRPLLLLR